MTNNVTASENDDIPRTVAAVSSTSSLDSFSNNVPQHLDSIPPLIQSSISSSDSQHTALLGDPVFSAPKLTVENPLVAHQAVSVTKSSGLADQTHVSSGSFVAPASGTNVTATNTANNGVAEFLYQLSKMLTDDNKEIIEWTNSKIEVHNPQRLANEVLHKYFRHSKFASFQRQLNYFGFRKLAGKGKMAPCSYVNDAASSELRSLLLIKRKTTPVTAREKGITKKRGRAESCTSTVGAATPQVNPVLANILHRSSSEPDEKSKITQDLVIGKGIKHQVNSLLKNPPVLGVPINDSHKALARSAVGRGIRHNCSSVVSGKVTAPLVIEKSDVTPTPASTFTFQDPHQLGMDVQACLSELSNNFMNSLKDTPSDSHCFGFLSRDSSLIDLAMLDPVEPTPVSEMQGTADSQLLSFDDYATPTHDFEEPSFDL